MLAFDLILKMKILFLMEGFFQLCFAFETHKSFTINHFLQIKIVHIFINGRVYVIEIIFWYEEFAFTIHQQAVQKIMRYRG